MLVTVVFVSLWWRGHFNLKALKQPRIDRAVARKLVSIGVPAVLEQGWCSWVSWFSSA